ncbi:MAG: hypothetical protein CSA83_01295, partial [Actinomycetales bacterium]
SREDKPTHVGALGIALPVDLVPFLGLGYVNVDPAFLGDDANGHVEGSGIVVSSGCRGRFR